MTTIPLHNNDIAQIVKLLQKKIPYKWRVQSFGSKKCSCVAYIDSRDAMNLLDEVFGLLWQSDFKLIGDHLVAGVGAKIDGEWVWKWDTGVESKTEGEKGLFSDSFKRACVKWGIGRFLYDLDIVYIDFIDKVGKKYPADNKGNIVYDVTEYINKLNKQ